MPFDALFTPADHAISQERSEIQLRAAELHISPELLTYITVVRQWQEYLTTQIPEQRQLLHTFLKSQGYLPEASKNANNVLARNREDVEAVSLKIMSGLAQGTIEVEALIKCTPEQFRQEHPRLTAAQANLLQNMLHHRAQIEQLDVDSIVRQSPFPVSPLNYFGRFLSGGCDTPQEAARHLQLANPFLIRMRSLLEGLENSQRNFLTLDIFSANEREAARAGTQLPPEQRLKKEQIDHVVSILHATINGSADFYSSLYSPAKSLECIIVPRLPNLDARHIEAKRHGELGVALFNWLFFGERDHELLNSRLLPAHREERFKELTKELQDKTAALKRHQTDRPDRYSTRKEVLSWRAKERELNKRIEKIGDSLEDINQDRSRITPLIKQLEDNSAVLGGIRTFRKQITKAQQNGSRIVFSFFGGRAANGGSEILEFIDDAMNNRKEAENPAVRLLKSSSFLLTPEATRKFHLSRHGADSVEDKHMRNFEVNTDEVNSSVRYLVADILPHAQKPQLQQLIDTIVKHLPPPGVNNAKDLTYLVQQACNKKTVNATHYIEYVFEHLPSMTQAQLLKLAAIMHKLDIETIPPRALEISLERFRHPAHTLDSYASYAHSYRPQKLGDAPEIFADLASFESYLTTGMASFGVAAEVDAIQKHLVESGIVAVVDGTNYHPELDAVVGMTGDKLDKSDSEKTTEVWGDYVRPSERVIRSLSLRLVEGEVLDELKNSSLMGVVKPDKVSQVMQKVIKKFYGIDIDITPDLSAINQVLSDLKLHDDKTILVIDARSINDLEEYRNFIELLGKYQIKIILRTREPFPGIPQVNLQPFLDHKVADRIMQESERLTEHFKLKQPLSRESVEFAANQVRRCRTPQADPLNLTLQTLQGAASHARLHDGVLTEQDIVAALPPIFHLPDNTQRALRLEAIDAFIEQAPLHVMGQEGPIANLGRAVRSHILGLRDPTRPLTILLPGPTGVGKTELLMFLARACDIPFFMIEGAEFSEEHTISRLVGSPTGYVGPDEGVLYKFLKENNIGLVFIDEIEKMHPSVYQALMNFFDKAELTAGNGEVVTRPGMIIVGASNAGAGRLTRKMSTREIKDVLADSFRDRFGNPRPELVRRFEPLVMHAIEEDAFKRMLSRSLQLIGERPGFINANLRLEGFDDAALKLLYDSSREVCEYHEKKTKVGFGVIQPTSSGLFYDMRHVSRALDELAGESLQQRAIEQYKGGQNNRRGEHRKVIMRGDLASGKIIAEISA